MNYVERNKAIRAKIKNELGYTSKQISIRGRICGYSDETRISIKDLTCDIDAVKKIANSFESIRYDEASGEILSGGNTYIFVEYDYDILKTARMKEMSAAETAFQNAINRKSSIFYTDKKGGEYHICIDSIGSNGIQTYSLCYFENHQIAGKNLTYGRYSEEQIKWEMTKYLALNKAKAI